MSRSYKQVGPAGLTPADLNRMNRQKFGDEAPEERRTEDAVEKTAYVTQFIKKYPEVASQVESMAKAAKSPEHLEKSLRSLENSLIKGTKESRDSDEERRTEDAYDPSKPLPKGTLSNIRKQGGRIYQLAIKQGKSEEEALRRSLEEQDRLAKLAREALASLNKDSDEDLNEDSFEGLVEKLEHEGKSAEYATKIAAKVNREKYPPNGKH